MTRAIAASAATLLALSACSMDPHYERPVAPVPQGWPVGDAYLAQSEAALPTVTYRDIFRDARLQGLIARALVGNQDLAVAAANVAQARAQFRVQRSALFPAVGANGQAVFSRNTANPAANAGGGAGTVTGGGSGGAIADSYRLTANLSAFEIDLFGRVRSLTRAARQEYFASEAGARTTRLALVGELASAWLTYAADRSLLGIAQETIRSAEATVRITNTRLTGGIAPRTDLRQAEVILERARSDYEDATTALAQDRNAIDLLVGSPVTDADLPATIDEAAAGVAELPAGLDSQVLLRRPDVVQAEYTLRAANARIGAARAAFFPRISLTALTGFASGALGSLFTNDAFTYSALPSAALPIFDGGANRGNLAFANAARDGAVASYRRAIQTAFREVSDALARRGTIDRQLAAETRLAQASADTLNLAGASYRAGITPFLNTLDAQRTYYTAQQTVVRTALTRADTLVTLYRVLGGDQLINDPAGIGPPPVPAG